MRAGHPEARSAGVSELVGSGRYRPGGSAETGGGISTKIRDGTESEEYSAGEKTGAAGGGEEESQGASGSSGAEWSGAEWSGAEDD